MSVRILTDRLELVPIDRDVANAFEHYTSRAKHIQSYLEKLQEDPELWGWGVWLVLQQDTREVLGDIGFKGKPVDETVEVGYGFVPEARNKGYATESVRALVQWAFSTKEVKQIMAECLGENQASINVLEKLGMQRTDEKNDMIYWKLTRSE